MAGNPIDKPYLMCDQHPYLINLAINRVQHTYPNRHGDIPAGWLNGRFLQGLAIDIQPIVQKAYTSCHVETDLKHAFKEEISEEDLRFREWDIEQKGENLYLVRNPLNQKEEYNVFLGNPVGCTCGKDNCEHIRTVLNS